MSEQTERRTIPIPSTEAEIELLKKTFKDNEFLIKLVRSAFYGFAIKDADKKLLKDIFSHEPTRVALRKKLYPVFEEDDLPIGSAGDFWIGTEQNILGMSKDTIHQVVMSKDLVKKWLEQGMEFLVNPTKPQPDISFAAHMLSDDPLGVRLLARNLYIRTIGQGLLFISQIVAMKQETKADKAKNSTK